MKKLTKVVGIILMCLGLVFMGTCAWQNCRKTTGPEAPKTTYQVTIQGTGNSYFTDKLTDENGIVTLYNYYEFVNGHYVLRKIELKLDRVYFGDIEIIEQ